MIHSVLVNIRKGHLSFHLLHLTLFTFRCHCIIVASYLLKITNCGPKSAKISTKKVPRYQWKSPIWWFPLILWHLLCGKFGTFWSTIGDFQQITGNYDAMAEKCILTKLDGMTNDLSNVRQNCERNAKYSSY